MKYKWGPPLSPRETEARGDLVVRCKANDRDYTIVSIFCLFSVINTVIFGHKMGQKYYCSIVLHKIG